MAATVVNTAIDRRDGFQTVIPHTSPSLEMKAFDCPSCHAFAEQQWFDVIRRDRPSGQLTSMEGTTLGLAICRHCQEITVWVAGILVHPEDTPAPPANVDLPEEIQVDYREAASIVTRSPRGAAALLRLCIQKLCKHLGTKGRNIDDDIGALVADGLPRRIQQALDILRVIGNEAVHPGTLDLKDDGNTALTLFTLLNLIADDRISEPKRIDELYGTLPEAKRQAIEARNQRALGSPQEPQ